MEHTKFMYHTCLE